MRETVSISRRGAAGFGSALAIVGAVIFATVLTTGAVFAAGLVSGVAFLTGAAVLALEAAGFEAAAVFAGVLEAAGFRAALLLVVFVGIPVFKWFAHGRSGVKA
jgi:hypothetical protein